ncbi:hypothetical protein INR49_011006 [Caranx melampygus]|nr:hypothetical protein INR49_011006 [Caranx melampygus]
MLRPPSPSPLRDQQYPGGGAVGCGLQVYGSHLQHRLPDPRHPVPGADPHHRWRVAGPGGGLVGGVKVGRSRASLPLQVEVERLRPPEDFLVSLEQHLLLVYTGKTRLARNLLQDVVRSWYSRLPSMVQNAQQLVATSEECARACSQGSLSGLGRCLERSWQQKKLMAPGCEPASVRTMMEALRPLVLGQSLAGAGATTDNWSLIRPSPSSMVSRDSRLSSTVTVETGSLPADGHGSSI